MERVQLHLEPSGVRRVRVWQWGNPAAANYRRVEVGHLGDGRWFASAVRDHRGAVVCRDREHAEQVAAGLREGDGWREVPAEFSGDGQPTEPGWVQRGGDWWRS
jgi:hypothetical protein